MSKHTQIFKLSTSKAEALEVSREVAVRMGWRVFDMSSSSLTIKEASKHTKSFTWPARIEISIKSVADDICEITLDGSIAGAGPIQRNHLKGQMGRVLNDLSLSIDQKNAQRRNRQNDFDPRSPSLPEEIMRLKELMDDGTLTAEEFAAAKARLLS